MTPFPLISLFNFLAGLNEPRVSDPQAAHLELSLHLASAHFSQKQWPHRVATGSVGDLLHIIQVDGMSWEVMSP